MDGIHYLENFISDPALLFDSLIQTIAWDESMRARKTASFGKAYNYSQINYSDQPFLPQLANIANQIKDTIGFYPNNCLINYYLDGNSKMGFHADQTDILVEKTGVVIISLGATRTLRFRNIADKSIQVDYPLPSGSLIYMTDTVQEYWHHAIPKSSTQDGRISLTFRKLK